MNSLMRMASVQGRRVGTSSASAIGRKRAFHPENSFKEKHPHFIKNFFVEEWASLRIQTDDFWTLNRSNVGSIIVSMVLVPLGLITMMKDEMVKKDEAKGIKRDYIFFGDWEADIKGGHKQGGSDFKNPNR